MSTPITITETHDGMSLSIAGGTYRILVPGSATGGAYAVIDMLVPPGGGPGPHAHPAMQETFYVMEGEVEFASEHGRQMASKGTCISIPFDGPVHRFRNISGEVARLMCIVTPAGLDSFFSEIGRPVANGEFLPPMPPSPEVMERIRAIGEKYGQQFFPGDYLDGV